MARAFPVILDCTNLVDRLESLAQADQLTPEAFAAIRTRLVGHLETMCGIVEAADFGAREMDALWVLRKASAVIKGVCTAHACGGLPPAMFEHTVRWLRAQLDQLQAWTDETAVPMRVRYGGTGPFQGFDDITGLPLHQVRFVDVGPRHFAVIEGGRA